MLPKSDNKVLAGYHDFSRWTILAYILGFIFTIATIIIQVVLLILSKGKIFLIASSIVGPTWQPLTLSTDFDEASISFCYWCVHWCDSDIWPNNWWYRKRLTPIGCPCQPWGPNINFSLASRCIFHYCSTHMADRNVLLLFLTSNKSGDGNDVEDSFRIARRLIISGCKKRLRVCSEQQNEASKYQTFNCVGYIKILKMSTKPFIL